MFKHIAAKVFSMKIVGTPAPQNERKKVGYYFPNFSIDLSGNTKKIIDTYYK